MLSAKTTRLRHHSDLSAVMQALTDKLKYVALQPQRRFVRILAFALGIDANPAVLVRVVAADSHANNFVTGLALTNSRGCFNWL
jgi:hypothetical protein